MTGAAIPPDGPANPREPEDTGGEPTFDFVTHRQEAVDAYQPLVALYADFAQAVYSVLDTCLTNAGIKVHSIQHRAKSLESFGDKARLPAEDNPNQPRYEVPLAEIRDLAGVRVITFFPSTESGVDRIITNEFEVVEKTDKSEVLNREERLGYHSIHYLVKLRRNRRGLPEYARFTDLVAEVQVRTILQHAWAEIEHDIQYKAASALPLQIRRRFMTLAGVLEIADREFQAIEDDSRRLKEEARESVAAGQLGHVEITPDALKTYLDRKFGPDGRMAEWSYDWDARRLQGMGFRDLQQLDEAISPYDDDQVSRLVHGTRQGQLTRLDDVLLAAMGDGYRRRHPWATSGNEWFDRSIDRRLAALRAGGIEVGGHEPPEGIGTGR